MAKHNDFSRGPVWKCIVVQAVPLMIAQLVQLLYNVVDRIYIGQGCGQDAMAGLTLVFPVMMVFLRFNQGNPCGSIDGIPLKQNIPHKCLQPGSGNDDGFRGLRGLDLSDV